MNRGQHPLFLDRPVTVALDTGSLVLLNLLVAFVYGATGLAGLQMAIVGNSVTLFWAPSGIAFAVVWLGGTRLAPGIALGALAVNLLTLQSPTAAAVLALGNTLPSLAARDWLQRVLNRFRDRHGLGELERVALFIVLAGLVSTMISATFGTIAISVIAGQEPLSFNTWFIWWMGDAWWSRLRSFCGSGWLRRGWACSNGSKPLCLQWLSPHWSRVCASSRNRSGPSRCASCSVW